MASPKIFVSSTCYDLSILRSQIRNFIYLLGYEPVMSDFNDLLYDPRNHTHENCVQEVNNCDMVVLFIGSRFGGNAIPKAIELIDFENIKSKSTGLNIFSSEMKTSITQIEIFRAIELGIPIFTFIDDKVFHEHHIYEKNKSKPEVMNNIIFPSIEIPETAVYIFEFINFMRLRTNNNSIYPFSKIDDIEGVLKKQWAGLFQRLLFETRIKKDESVRMQSIEARLDDIKTMIVTTITNEDLKITARGVFKYRSLIEFLLTVFKMDIDAFLNSKDNWDELTQKADFEIIQNNSRDRLFGIFIVFKDRKYTIIRIPLRRILTLNTEWNEFKQLNSEAKEAIINAIKESESINMRIRPISNITYEEYLIASEKRTNSDEMDEENDGDK